MIWVEKKFKNCHGILLAISKKLIFCMFKIYEPVIMYNSSNFQLILDFSKPQLISQQIYWKFTLNKFFVSQAIKIMQPSTISETPKNCVLKILKLFYTAPGLV